MFFLGVSGFVSDAGNSLLALLGVVMFGDAVMEEKTSKTLHQKLNIANFKYISKSEYSQP